MATGCAEGCFGVIDSTTVRALHPTCSIHLHLLFRDHITIRTKTLSLALHSLFFINWILRVKRNIFDHKLV